MSELAKQLDTANGTSRILIVTDGVFSIDGYLANLPAICELVYEHGTFVMVEGSNPITPIMLGNAALARRFADAMLDNGRLSNRIFLTRRASRQSPHPLANLPPYLGRSLIRYRQVR